MSLSAPLRPWQRMNSRPTSRRAVGAVAALTTSATLLASLAAPAGATFPGENGQIAYDVYGLYVSDLAKQVRTQIHPVGPGPDWNDPSDPQFLPDGERIAYEYAADIYVSRTDRPERVNLTEDQPHAFDPAPAPTGEIAFSRHSTGAAGRHLFVMEADGSDVRQITSGSVRDEDASWSPDGDRIVFTRTPVNEQGYNAGPPAIYAVDPDGTDLTPLFARSQNPYGAGPTFTPDGDHILFRSAGVHLMNEDGTNPHPLFQPAGGGLKDVVASPDGSRLALVQGFVDSCEPVGDCITHDELILSAMDGSGARTFHKSGYMGEIDWGPAPDGGFPSPDSACDGHLATIQGTLLPDSITGTDEADVIAGLSGEDYVFGEGGADVVCGGEGDQVLTGGAGADLLIPGPGSDKVRARAGHDSISLRDGSVDQVNCGTGRDVVRVDRADEVARSCERVRR
jgi:RTX calcium-binding nonapeptide repeat (4 copies)/WD40-like Beta Propeller Repeat